MEKQKMSLTAREIAGDKYILWGASWSLYTAKVRPYLIKKGIDYVEINPSHPEYNSRIIPTVGYFTVPVLETPDGEIIADSTKIMEYLEPKFSDPPMLPEDKSLAAIARLIHSFGSEGLTKSAMYLRWNTTFEQRVWVREDFSRTLATPEQTDEFAIAMRSFLPILGITLDHPSDVAIERSIDELYEVLNAHFQKYPYILGGVPSLADYGLMGSLYAHHCRDLFAGQRFKKAAPALHRWTETMLRPPIADPELWNVPQEYFSIDDLPETLTAFLKLVCENYVPEMRATIDLYHEWLDAQDRPAGAVIDMEDVKRCHQVLGQIEHDQMGVPIKRIALLDDVRHHMDFQSHVDGMNAVEKQKLSGVLQNCGAADLLDIRLKRGLERRDYTWVLV
jgi:glutathione S-transferase